MRRPFKQLTKRQQWQSIVSRLNKAIGELEQLVIDGNYFNGLPKMANEVPLDLEEYRVEATRLKKQLADFVRQNPPESI